MKKSQFISRYILILFSAFICLNSFAIDGNGKLLKQDRPVTAFNSIEVGGAFNIILTQGEKESLAVETDENLQEYIITKVNGNKLSISTKKGMGKSKALNLYITIKDLKKLDISGATNLKTLALITFKEIEINASGATDIKMTILAEKLNLTMSGSGDAELNGSAKDIKVDISGAGTLNAITLHCETAFIIITGAGNVKVNTKRDLNVEVSGAGSVEYKGNPNIKKKISGAGSVKQIK